ncbi:MAG: alpha-amylase family glycosyl hydrolase, partial [Ignavibacteriaceae bacterium]
MFSKISVKILFSLILINVGIAQEINDLIEPVKLTKGMTDTILVSDLFYAKNYDISFSKNKDISFSFDKSTKKLVLKPEVSFKGFTLLNFSLDNKSYVIPLILQDQSKKLQSFTFRFKPEKKTEKVVVIGSFNNWNREWNPLIEKGNSGIYEAKVNLEPGNYFYKFSIDGKDIIDPENKETVPTGFDGFNSVLRITELRGEKRYLHILGKSEDKNGTRLSFYYERENQKKKISKASVFALLNNKRIKSNAIKISGNKIEISLPKTELRNDQVLRIVVSQDGKNSNIQSVFFNDGKISGTKNNFASWYDGSIYSIMVDRFSDGDKSNDIPVKHDSLSWQANYQGGDFQGIINKIDDGYFGELGINTLWISPVYDNPGVAYREYPKPNRWFSGYHGYWPVNNFAVEEKFGTLKKLKELVTTAHQHKIKVLLDIVAHHVHLENPIFKEHPDWFGTLDLPDGRKNLRLWDEYRLTTWFEPYMPSFDFTKSDVPTKWMAQNALWWLKESGADGFRHDAVKHVPNEFWRELTRTLKEEIETPLNKKVYQIGETFGSNELVGS